jgi:hypothetical protein
MASKASELHEKEQTYHRSLAWYQDSKDSYPCGARLTWCCFMETSDSVADRVLCIILRHVWLASFIWPRLISMKSRE